MFLRTFEPDNRLVAASLEAEWNSKLHALSEAEQNYECQRQADQLKVSSVQRQQVLALATNFPQLWNDPGTADRERNEWFVSSSRTSQFEKASTSSLTFASAGACRKH